MTSAGKQSSQQLPLQIKLRDEATRDNFFATPLTEPLLEQLESQLAPQGEPIILLYGPGACGKSHLLQASCHLAGSAALYLPLRNISDYSPEEVLSGVESLNLVCLDDLDAVLGVPEWELALFNLFNRARAAQCRLLVAASAAPRALSLDLEDLRSRLSWGIVYQLQESSDDDKTAILQFRASRRGLHLTDEVARYIVNRAPRSLDHLLALLDDLDQASLVEKRALSIPFVKQALGW